MMHDFALTAHYVVLLDLPVTFSLKAVTKGIELPYVWNPPHQARVGLFPGDGSSSVRWIEVEPCWVFPCLNAYEDSHGRVLVDLCQYNEGFDVSTMWAAHGPVTLDRWTIDPAAGTVTQQRVDDRGQEFPRVDDRVVSARIATGTAPLSARSSRPSRPPAISPTTPSLTPSSSTTWTTPPCRRTSSAATPLRAMPFSPRPRQAQPRTTAM